MPTAAASRTLRLAATVAAVCVLALLAAPSPARAATTVSPGPNFDVTRLDGTEAEPAIAVNPRDPNNVVVVSTLLYGEGMHEAWTFDGGRTWNRRIIARTGPLAPACCDPSLAFDRFGNLFLTYLYLDDFTVLPIAISKDGGYSFGLLAEIPAPQPEGTSNFQAKQLEEPEEGRPGTVDQPTIVTGPGSVWVTFNGTNGIRAAGARVTGLGPTHVGAFEPTEGAPQSQDGNYGDVAIGPGGQVLVTYQIPSGGQLHADIYVNLDPDGLGPKGFGDAIHVTGTNVGGFDYIPPQPNRSVDAEAGLAWDRSSGPHRGRVYLMYTSEEPSESGDTDLQLLRSDDAGRHWSAPVRINDDRTTNAQFLPRMSLDQTTGVVGFTWLDARRDQGDGGPGDTDGLPNTDAQLFAAVSVNGGLSVTPNVRVSEGISNARRAGKYFDYGDYTALDFNRGAMWPAWPDNSDSAGQNPTPRYFDMYTARIRVST